MPELPEVETTKNGLLPLMGRVIQTVHLGHPLREAWPADLAALLTGRRVTGLSRRAKYVLMALDSGATLILHLGMSGRLALLEEEVGSGIPPRARHDHFELGFGPDRFGRHTLLRLTDPRRFGAVYYQAAGETHVRLGNLGPEPLESAFTAQHLADRARGRSTAIKPFIMDQTVVVGVGNIYASEALFAAGIDPRRAAGRVSKARLEKLVDAIHTVLEKALEMKGTTLRDYRLPNGGEGAFVQRLTVYGRGGEPCVVCQTPLKEVVLGQRSSFYCPHCQR
jgi:formamidopyrimidine-DNA glycosylase